MIGLSTESCRWGTSSDGRVLALFPESCLKGLSIPRLSSNDGLAVLLSGREKLKDGLDRPALLIDLSDASDGDRFIGGRNGEAGVLGALKDEPDANDRLSTSSECMSSMTDLMVGEFACDRNGGDGG